MSSPVAPHRPPQKAAKGMGTALLASLLVSGVVIGARQLGWLQPLELLAIDHLTRWQPSQPPDPRLLIVEITQADINTYGKSDRVLSQLINKLQPMRPRVIGFDINASDAFEPGRAALLEDLRVNKNIVAVCGRGSNNDSFAPPPGPSPEQVGFADVVRDPDFVLRRNLLTIPLDLNAPPACRSAESLGLRLAIYYLSQQGVTAQRNPQDQLQIGKAQFPALTSSWGGYQHLDNRGEQIFLQYRSPSIAPKVSLKQVLDAKVPASQVKDKIVLIGITAKSGKDFFITPWSAANGGQEMAGVEIHAQATSQILSAVLDGKPLVWVWPTGIDWLWIWGWGAAGTLLAWKLKRLLWRGMVAAVGLASLTGVSVLLFSQAGWIPLIPAALTFSAGMIVTAAASAYRQQPALQPIAESVSEATPVNSATPVVTMATQASQTPEQPVTPPAMFLKNRYQIDVRLGHGQFGITYKAKDMQRPGQPVCVVKQLKLNALDADELKIARDFFQREAEMLEGLGEHDQIPRLLAYFEDAQQFYLVQEYIPGTVLNQLIGNGETLPEAEVIAILKDILPILEFIHSKGVIHRDIKPANLIRREPDQRIVLIDFGAVKQLHSTIVHKPIGTVIIGTLGYAAPEQLHGRPVVSSDLYALGMVALQALGGLSVTDLQTLGDRESPQPEIPTSQKPLAAIVTKMIEYEPHKRYQSAREVLDDLEQV